MTIGSLSHKPTSLGRNSSVSTETLQQVPCPVLRTLVNEGRITPNASGVVELRQLDGALKSIGLSGLVRKVLVGGADATRKDHAGALLKTLSSSQFNILKLNGSSLDHVGDTRILRDGAPSAERLAWLTSFSRDGKTLTLDDLSAAQKDARQSENAGVKAAALGVAELCALLLVFGTPDSKGKKALGLADLQSLYVDAKFPPGWEVRETNGMDLVVTVAKMAFTQAFTSNGRARLGMDKALERDVALDLSSSKGLQNALCPAGMRPATKPQP
ncbi:MAG TPA: hypothetical protein VGF99_16405, partial [Myxococcota bacterium]